jgi:ribosomal protein S18 acetylase RimI-like enzyme
MFSRFEGEVLDRGEYTVIKTPTNPGYHWGNYIIFSQPPKKGDLEKWQAIYRSEFTYYDSIKHMTFTWNQNANIQPDFEPFLKAGFKLDLAKVLTAQVVSPPPKFNQTIEVRGVQSDDEWEQAIQLQIACRQPCFEKAGYETFKRRQFKNYQAMFKAGLGNWFGAFLDKKMVGDLGIFHQDRIGRFQNVGTHPEYRRQGICGTLVYQAAQIAFHNSKSKPELVDTVANLFI